MVTLKKSEGEITINVKNNLVKYYNNLLNNNLLNSTVVCDKYKFNYPINENYLQMHSFYTFIPEPNTFQFKLIPEDSFQRTKFIIDNYTGNAQECIYFNNITDDFSITNLIGLNGSSNVDLLANIFKESSYTSLINNILSNTDGSKQAVYFNSVILDNYRGYEALVIHALPRYRITGNNQVAFTFAPFKFFGASELNNSSNLTLKYLVNVLNPSYNLSFIKFHIYETLILCSCNEKDGDKYKILTTKIVDPGTTNWNSVGVCL